LISNTSRSAPAAPYLIGLTGNIACGKSTVVAMLEELGAHVLDADEVTRALQQPGQQVYDAIVAEFGPSIQVSPGGALDRSALAAIVFTDPAALARLERIVHPAVREYILAWIDRLRQLGGGPHGRHIGVIDAIKLLEGGWKSAVDAVWVVTCEPAQQLRRLVETRAMSEAEARRRIEAQSPQAQKVAQADVVIDNSSSLESTRAQVLRAYGAIPRQGAG
jgi:dephospho-CoA kinase